MNPKSSAAAAPDKSPFEFVKQLDIFPKVASTYKETSSSGGTVTLVCLVLIVFLVGAELGEYFNQQAAFSYGVDPVVDGSLKLTYDIVVAMPCDLLGADVLQATGTSKHGHDHSHDDAAPVKPAPPPSPQEPRNRLFNVMRQSRDTGDDGRDDHGHDEMRKEPVVFALSAAQREWLAENRKPLTREHLSLSGTTRKAKKNFQAMPRELSSQEGTPDACRLHGSVSADKIAGNFHIIAGAAVEVPGGHAHMGQMIPQHALNFTHRINHLSFGEEMPGMEFPLDGDEWITTSHTMAYQYFIQVVPTVYTRHANDPEQLRSGQFSVTRHESPNSNRLPGLFFKYDTFPILVTVQYSPYSFWHLLIRLSGIIGGVFATSGFIHQVVRFVFDKYVSRKFARSTSTDAGLLTPTD
ncbi:hypothetical protein CAOG_05384 [Capsaspora owczarzaki ATCC 30864]|uniref:Endoplasmic reticulum-Golgi intermediate compartment protein 2 n=1 Tax=Capsaspora owczarzaki (strain ATCC 30864) TaxID=595528 RepID=A0A0D2VTZ0_CAPO3|nr:hypothetical protein CAOG_05384 [Capsaspora owczarzaki ATCC 30864]KJE94807.1 hypothetical protein CAOG_005384 [Capsaspora owczarzaki ATCC 30864]|eukprot:XP_004347069.1 hypothetical protein CAOG_05384 [Capsaspora owczarzaki ATCC 30864]